MSAVCAGHMCSSFFSACIAVVEHGKPCTESVTRPCLFSLVCGRLVPAALVNVFTLYRGDMQVCVYGMRRMRNKQIVYTVHIVSA